MRGAWVLIPGWGTKIPHAKWQREKKKSDFFFADSIAEPWLKEKKKNLCLLTGEFNSISFSVITDKDLFLPFFYLLSVCHIFFQLFRYFFCVKLIGFSVSSTMLCCKCEAK